MTLPFADFNPHEGTRKSLGAEDKSSQGLQDFSENNAIAKCPKCNSNEVFIVPTPEKSVHSAALRCKQCDFFLGWQPKPESQERRKRQQTAISQLLKSPQLSDWERGFLLSMRDRRALSPKQQELLNRIELKVGGLL